MEPHSPEYVQPRGGTFFSPFETVSIEPNEYDGVEFTSKPQVFGDLGPIRLTGTARPELRQRERMRDEKRHTRDDARIIGKDNVTITNASDTYMNPELFEVQLVYDTYQDADSDHPLTVDIRHPADTTIYRSEILTMLTEKIDPVTNNQISVGHTAIWNAVDPITNEIITEEVDLFVLPDSAALSQLHVSFSRKP